MLAEHVCATGPIRLSHDKLPSSPGLKLFCARPLFSNRCLPFSISSSSQLCCYAGVSPAERVCVYLPLRHLCPEGEGSADASSYSLSSPARSARPALLLHLHPAGALLGRDLPPSSQPARHNTPPNLRGVQCFCLRGPNRSMDLQQHGSWQAASFGKSDVLHLPSNRLPLSSSRLHAIWRQVVHPPEALSH